MGEEGAGCKCRPGEVFGWRYATLDQGEVDMQKRFLKKHLELGNLKRLRPKFLKPGPQQVAHICQFSEKVFVQFVGFVFAGLAEAREERGGCEGRVGGEPVGHDG